MRINVLAGRRVFGWKTVNRLARDTWVEFSEKPITAVRSFIPIEPIPETAQLIFVSRFLRGLGDVISSLSAVQTLKKLRPNVQIFYGTAKVFHPLLENHPMIERVLPQKTVGYDHLINFDSPCPCGFYESRTPKIELAREQIFTLSCGLPWLGIKPEVYPRARDLEFAHEFLEKFERPLIGLVLRTAEKWKNWPFIEKLARRLIKRKVGTVFLFDKRIGLSIKYLVNITGFDLGKVAGLVASMDLLVSPDTGLFHLAEALDTTCIALFGSMDSRIRRSLYDSSTVYVQGRCKYERDPCFYSVCEGRYAIQPCMKSISVKEVIKKIEEVLS